MHRAAAASWQALGSSCPLVIGSHPPSQLPPNICTHPEFLQTRPELSYFGSTKCRAVAARKCAHSALSIFSRPPAVLGYRALRKPIMAHGQSILPHMPHKVWADDDVGLTEGPLADTDADVTRAIAADEELQALLQAGEEQPEASTSYSLDHLEQAKLLLSGGVAGAFSKSCTAPLARLTILYQVRHRWMQAAAAVPPAAWARSKRVLCVPHCSFHLLSLTCQTCR